MNGLVNQLPKECYPIQWGEYCILEEKTMYLQGGKTALWQGGGGTETTEIAFSR